MRKMYTNPKLIEYQKDEAFIQNLIRERNFAERRHIKNAVMSVLIGAIVILVCWVIAVQLEG